MRLTNSMISRDYLKSLNSSLKDMTDMNTRITAERKYMKYSDDPINATKAMQVRKNLSRIAVYQNNLSDAQSTLSQYETTISNINELVTEAMSQLSQGTTGTSDAAVRQTVANTLRGYQESILAAANTKYAGDYVFGGENSATIPFTLDDSGKLLYNGQSVDTGTFEAEERFIDIGIGLTAGVDGQTSSRSAMNVAHSGATLLGTGTDANGISNNLYNLLGEIADKLESGDLSDIQLYSDKLDAKSDDIRIQYVSVGEKSNYITFFSERLKSENTNLTKRQTELEGIDVEKAIIEFGEMEMAYNACLQMGTKILQPSLLDYLD